MIRITAFEASSGDPSRIFRIAGVTVGCDVDLPELAPFTAVAAGPRLASPTRVDPGSGGQLLFAGEAPLGRSSHHLTCSRTPAGFILDIAGCGRCFVATDGETILYEAALRADLDVWAGVVLGPALLLALARRSIFALHASAVFTARDGAPRAVAFLGPSGWGKSTLARLLDGAGGPWQRLADDVLPVLHSVAGPRALPHYPQLKLASARQPALGVPEEMNLAAICVLSPPTDQPLRPEITELPGAAATAALVGQTVAARLFDDDLLSSHLGFCGELGSRVPVWRLRHRRRPDIGADVAAALARLLPPG